MNSYVLDLGVGLGLNQRFLCYCVACPDGIIWMAAMVTAVSNFVNA